MILTLRTEGSAESPATDLGYLLHKNPTRAHEAAMSFGKAHVLFPEASESACTAAVVLEVDSVGLVRKGEGGRWDEYVNDRPYVASSFLSSALAEFFGTAMGGRSKERPALAATAIGLEVRIPAVRVRGGEGFARSLFEPLGWTVEATRLPLDPEFPEWGEGNLFSLVLKGTLRVADALTQLYVLIPVLDDDKHYFLARDEVDKLLNRGGEWLLAHPLREEISRRYLLRRHSLTREALARLTELDGDPDPDARERAEDERLEERERKISLHDARLNTVREALKEAGARRVLDLGCGEGKLLKRLLADPFFTEIVGMDVSVRALESAKRRLQWEEMSDRNRARLALVHGSLTYRDRGLEGYDGAALVEVIEHLDEARLAALSQSVFGEMRPGVVLVTTPNREYNPLFEGLAPGAMRHPDHRFEWDRAEFAAWGESVAARHGYRFEARPLGEEADGHGAPSQMGVFRR